MPYITIIDLPPELLHIVISQLAGNRGDWDCVRACSLTCRRLREVAVEYLFRDLSLQHVTSLDHLVRFLSANPGAASHVATLNLQGAQCSLENEGRSFLGTAIDDRAISRVVELLPNLQDLTLRAFTYTMPPHWARIGRHSASKSDDGHGHGPGPFLLRRLSLYTPDRWYAHSSLSGLLRVLSLFTAATLDMTGHNHYLFDDSPFDRRCMHHRSLAVSRLHVNSSKAGARNTFMLLDALAGALQAGRLWDLSASCDSPEAVHALGRLLARAGSEVTALNLRIDAPFFARDRATWVDPLRDHWRALNISACTSLQHVKIPIYIGPTRTRQGQAASAQKALAKPATRLIEHASRTLETVHIVVHGLPHPAKLGSTSSTLRLQQLERVLGGDRAPNLAGVRLTIVSNCELQSRFRYWPRCVEAACSALGNLNARGLLEVDQRGRGG